MEEEFYYILKACNFLPSNKFKRIILGNEEIIESLSYLQFIDVLILSSCSKFLREKIEIRYKILFSNHFPLLKDLSLEDDKCYGTWLNIFKSFKEIAICDEILQLIDLEIPTDEKIIYVPIFPIPKCEIRHLIIEITNDWVLLPNISHCYGWQYCNRMSHHFDETKIDILLTLIKRSKKTYSDFINCGFFPISLKKLKNKINEILEIPKILRDDIALIANRIRRTPSYKENFNLQNCIKEFVDEYFYDKEFSELFVKYAKNFCKLYLKENSIENVFLCYKNFSSGKRYEMLL